MKFPDTWSPPPPQVADFLELLYDMERGERAWLQGIIDVMAASLSGIDHASGVLYRISPERAFLPLLPLEWAGGRPLVQALAPLAPTHHPTLIQSIFGRPLFTMSELLASVGMEHPGVLHFDQTRTLLDLHDAWDLHGVDAEGSGVILTASTPMQIAASEAQRAPWAMVASHLGVALRLRRRLARGAAQAEAFLSPGGALAHAEGIATAPEAIDSLRTATRSIDRARSRFRRKPDEALEAWQAVVSGRWTLVDQHDSDGKRFVVARVNRGQVEGPATLSERERQAWAYAGQGHTNKLVASAMGITPSTVSGYLRRVAKKLGVTSRVALVRRWREQGADGQG